MYHLAPSGVQIRWWHISSTYWELRRRPGEITFMSNGTETINQVWQRGGVFLPRRWWEVDSEWWSMVRHGKLKSFLRCPNRFQPLTHWWRVWTCDRLSKAWLRSVRKKAGLRRLDDFKGLSVVTHQMNWLLCFYTYCHDRRKAAFHHSGGCRILRKSDQQENRNKHQ